MRSFHQFLQSLQGSTFRLLLLGGGLLLLWGIFAPVGTLVWWLNEGQESIEAIRKRQITPRSSRPSFSSSPIDCYIIYFPGVGDYSANQITPGEEFFLTKLTQRYPNCVAVSDVFPYSASNVSLGGQRFLAPIWTAIERGDGWLKNADVLIKIRNLWRFAISADDRYGEIYNRGIALAVLDRMNAAYPISKARQAPKVILVGTSGGAQVALGSAQYLVRSPVQPEIYVVSLGGTFEGNVGFDAAEQVNHLTGEADWVDDLTAWIFPSRWGITVGSPFNQAKQEGRYWAGTTGPHEHDGDRGYFGLSSINNSPVTYVEVTLQEVSELPIWSAPVSNPLSPP
jgi:hypothetical protein